MAINASGLPTARKVAEALGAPLHGREGRVDADVLFPDALAHARDLFAAGTAIVGVCASGILIRGVAPLLSDKRAEPPVLSVSDDGGVVVPLLGGHRGANRLARRIAEATGGTAAVTTAGDVALGVALDEPPEGWTLRNPEHAKPAMAALLSGGGAAIEGVPWLDLPPGDAVRITGTTAPLEGAADHLVFHPRRFVLGVGASRGCPAGELAALVDAALSDLGLAPQSLAAIATADLKADEPAVVALAKRMGLPLRLFDAATLEEATPRTATPSDVVFAELGTHGVSENAALACAGPDATLASPKRKSAMATVAVAEAPQPIATLAGRPRGRVSLVGIGPGQAAWRTPEASRLIAAADELVGYSLYIDLLGPLAAGKPRADFPLGGEEARCRHALDRAAEGRDVALICSGDAGIYAMGALVLELMDREDAPRAWGGVSVVHAPGISALQAAAARSGAPLGHDFCAISLSDLLTPREDILRRLRAAAEGDFVVALYNPVSRKRRDLMAHARDILLTGRPADTPVLLASSLGRPEESLRIRRLAEVKVDEIDMLTVVLIGSSNTRVLDTAEGPRLYTPRGYARKMAGGDLA